jgi:hypothetical protein
MEEIDFAAWTDEMLVASLPAGRKARSPHLPALIAEMEKRGIDTTDQAEAAFRKAAIDDFLNDLGL